MDDKIATERKRTPAGLFPARLKALGLESLGRMYDRANGVFHFRVRRNHRGLIPEGISRRYTAIALLGLSGEDPATIREILSGESPESVYDRLAGGVAGDSNLGDVALTLWAGIALGHEGASRAADRIHALRPGEGVLPTVELSWTLAALCMAGRPEDTALRDSVAKRLQSVFRPNAAVFPHRVGETAGGVRAHVSCFADLVYPVQALAFYARITGDNDALKIASACARHFCSLQGDAGQWWWHYDARTGGIVEGYPVYAVHQDAMAPMALFALEEAGGGDFRREIRRGLDWLRSSPELHGGSLVDDGAGIIWRKVARREPGKFTRYIKGAAVRIHPGIRVPGLDPVFPPRAVDFEDRPYHIGWLLYAWPDRLLGGWDEGTSES